MPCHAMLPCYAMLGCDEPTHLPPALTMSAARAAAAASYDHHGAATPMRPAEAPAAAPVMGKSIIGTPPASLDARITSTAAPRVQ